MYIGHMQGWNPKNIFYILGHLLHFLRHAAESPFFPPQNAIHFIMFVFFGSYSAFYIKFASKFKYPTLLPKG